MSQISIQGLTYEYATYQKIQGLRGSLIDFFRRDITKALALQNISLTIEEGEMVGLLGPNGAGKTTLMKVLSGLIHPTKGQVEALGYCPSQKSPRYLQQIGLVLGQKSQLTWELPSSETLAVLKEIYRIPESEYRERLDFLSDVLNVAERLDTPVRKLSLGERMKFELIAALIHRPRLLLLDEPTIGLDIGSQRAIRTFLQSVNRRFKTTIIVTSHYARDIEALANRLIILKAGRIHYDGSLAALLISHQDTKVLRVEADDLTPNHSSRFAEVSEGVWECQIEPSELNEVLAMLASEVRIKNVTTYDKPLEDVLYALFMDELMEQDVELEGAGLL